MKDHLQIIRGLSCPAHPPFTRKSIEDAMDFVPGDGDLILASYPKTGSTWLIYIILQIKSRGEFLPAIEDVFSKIVPYVALYGVTVLEEQGNKPKFYRQHFPYNYLKKNSKSKCIYIYRLPEDTVVSYYHFDRSMLPQFTGEFDEYFNDFSAGKVRYGNYFQHVLSFYEHRTDDNLLMVSYEKLHANKKEEILRIAKFLDEAHYQSLFNDEELLNRIVERTSFDYMKKNIQKWPNPFVNTDDPSKEKPEIRYFRKGIVGDGKTTLTDTQRQSLKEAAENVLKGTSIIEEWYPK